MTAAELAEALLASRGSLQERAGTHPPGADRYGARCGGDRTRDRAASRWIVRRVAHGGHILLARDELAEDGTPSIDGERLGRLRGSPWQTAQDELAKEDPLRPPGRVLEALQAVEPPPGVVARPASNRLLQLAAATSQHAALSSRLGDLSPCGMPAARALKLALGALAGAKELTPEQVRERVAGRYPEAEPLPGRPGNWMRCSKRRAASSEWQAGGPGREGRLRLAPTGVHDGPLRHVPPAFDHRSPALR